MLEYKVISPNRNHVTSIEEAKTYLLRDQDPFLSLVRPPKSNFDDLDDEYLTLKKYYEAQKQKRIITRVLPKKTDLVTKSTQIIQTITTNEDVGNTLLKQRLQGLIKLPTQKLNDPTIISWLQNEFEIDDGSSVPRGLMYDAYKEFCRAKNHCIVNQACFGKTVRNVFPNLLTRRLGNRGKSKYHYFGLRAKTGTVTADLILRKQGSSSKALRSHRRQFTLDLPDEQLSVTAMKDLPLECLSDIIHTIIPKFPTKNSIHVSDTVQTEANVFLQCSELYAAEVLKAVFKTDFQEVFKATQAYWKTARLVITEDSRLSHPDILKLISECDTKIQATMRDVLIPDLFTLVPEEKKRVFETVFNGVYLNEMMSATKPAPEEVKQLKKEAYRKFSRDVFERLKFTIFQKEVQHLFEHQAAIKSLHKALTSLDVNYVVSKCRFAFIINKTSLKSTEKQLREGLVTLQYSLYNGFSTPNFLKWVKSKLITLIQGDTHCSHQKDRIKLIILCASYAIGLIFNELEKKTEMEFRGGLRKLQLLLTDYICLTAQEQLNN